MTEVEDITLDDWIAAHRAAKDDRVQLALLGRDITPIALAIAQARVEGRGERR